jgi:hypothetical protein
MGLKDTIHALLRDSTYYYKKFIGRLQFGAVCLKLWLMANLLDFELLDNY